MAIIINGINSGMVSLVDQHPVISLDLSTRQFTWPTDYKVVAIMGDANSQKLTFEVPAIYEGIDLTDTTCVLTYWTSWTNDEGKHSTGTVNLELTELENAKEGYLYYTWTLDQNQTANSGEVKFKIGFYLVLDEFDPSGYEDLSYIITDGHLAIYNNLELVLTTDNYYALSSNSGTFNVIPDGISGQAKIRLVDWATKAEQAANEATGAANNANIQAERAKDAADNANSAAEATKKAIEDAEDATTNANTATEEVRETVKELTASVNALDSAVLKKTDVKLRIVDYTTEPVYNVAYLAPIPDTLWHCVKYDNNLVECWFSLWGSVEPNSEGTVNWTPYSGWASEENKIYYHGIGDFYLPRIFDGNEILPFISYDIDAQDSWGNKYPCFKHDDGRWSTGGMYLDSPILNTEAENYTINILVKGIV